MKFYSKTRMIVSGLLTVPTIIYSLYYFYMVFMVDTINSIWFLLGWILGSVVRISLTFVVIYFSLTGIMWVFSKIKNAYMDVFVRR